MKITRATSLCLQASFLIRLDRVVFRTRLDTHGAIQSTPGFIPNERVTEYATPESSSAESTASHFSAACKTVGFKFHQPSHPERPRPDFIDLASEPSVMCGDSQRELLLNPPSVSFA